MTLGRVAVITGGGRGIGRAVALSLAQRGYAIALAGRSRAPLIDTAADVERAGGKALPVETDVTDAVSVDQLFSTVLAEFGRVDLLFNNAGHMPPSSPPDEVPLETWRKAIEVNLTGSFICLRAAFGVMKSQDPRGGRIINNGSIAAHAPRPNSIVYTASKHAITGLTRSALLDGRNYDIAVGQIDIGNAASELISAVQDGVLQSSGLVISEPLMDVRHVGEAVAYMDSLPLEANVPFLTVMATKMPYIGRG